MKINLSKLTKITRNPVESRWTDADLNRMREVMDDPADEAAAALFKSKNIRGAMQMLHALTLNDSSVDLEVDGFEIPQELKDYLNDLSHFQFTEKEKAILDEAADFFELYGPIITMNLALRSLLKQYAATKATNVLRMTTLLTEYTDRRVTETFQFVLDVMQKKWYEPGKRGIRSIQKLRLIHALIRFRILKGQTPESEGKWNPEWGKPINQEDMIFANQTFSVEVLQGLEQIGVALTRDQVDSYFRAWVLIGKALGVDPRLEAKTFEEGEALQAKIYERQFTLPNGNGPALAEALIEWLVKVIPFKVKRRSIFTFIKFFNGVENYPVLENNLKIDLDDSNDNFYKHVHQELKWVNEELEKTGLLKTMTEKQLSVGNYPAPVAHAILEFLSNKILRGIFAHKRGSKSTSFQIDDALANKWGLPSNDGIPRPKMPGLDDNKKRHPIIQFFYSIGTWIVGLVVKVRELFAGK